MLNQKTTSKYIVSLMISVVKEATRILKKRIKEGTDLDQGATRGIS